MTDAILTSGNYRIVATVPFDLESPRWGAEVGSMFCVQSRYNLGDEHVGLLAEIDQMYAEQGEVAVIEWLRDEHGVTVVLPLFLYDHSGLSIRAGSNLIGPDGIEVGALHASGWDTSLVGAIFATAESVAGAEILGDIEAVLRAEVAEYDKYLTGDVQILRVEQQVTEVRRSAFTYPDRVEVRDSIHNTWEPIADAAVTTTYGTEHHAEIAAEMLAEYVPAEPAAEVQA